MRAQAAVTRRRSCLSVPGGEERKVARAMAGRADEVVLDLEDSVPAEVKDAARGRLVTALREAPVVAGRAVAVRVNAVRSPWCHRDLAALAALPVVTSVVVPKVEDPGDLAFVERLLDGLEEECGRSRPLGVQALVETAAGLACVGPIAAAAERLEALVLGYADLAASLGGPPAARQRALDLWLPAQHALLVAARAAGVQAIDGPYLGVEVDEQFSAAVDRVRDLGFDGKWAIHPRQVDALDAAFTPTRQEVHEATRVLDALADARRRGLGAARLDGQMLDEAVAVAARRVLSRVPTTVLP